MSPLQTYQKLMHQSGFESDSAQLAAIEKLDALYEKLLNQKSKNLGQRLLKSILPGAMSAEPDIQGLYLWGGVGRGKTMLMDIFYKCLAAHIDTQRCHFHGFMNQLHQSLGKLKNTESPLKQLAKEIAARTRVLCLDEFVIIDIGDAMIMAGLLKALFDLDVLLVTTSNAAPKNLYQDGLQRSRFLPAIRLIEDACEVKQLDNGQDYRLVHLQKTELYCVPHSKLVDDKIDSYLNEQVKPFQKQQVALQVNGRNLKFRFCAQDVVWFDFNELCDTNRSQNDYLELARLFNCLIITDIQQLDATSDDVARRFVLLIDLLYDHRVKLICSAVVIPTEIYQGKRMKFEFERAASRLIEMQSDTYLSQAHAVD